METVIIIRMRVDWYSHTMHAVHDPITDLLYCQLFSYFSYVTYFSDSSLFDHFPITPIPHLAKILLGQSATSGM